MSGRDRGGASDSTHAHGRGGGHGRDDLRASFRVFMGPRRGELQLPLAGFGAFGIRAAYYIHWMAMGAVAASRRSFG